MKNRINNKELSEKIENSWSLLKAICEYDKICATNTLNSYYLNR